MLVTFNTSAYSKSNYNRTQSSFNGTTVPVKSAFLKPFDTAMDKLTDGIAKNYTSKAFSNRFTNWLAKKDNIGQIVDHMQTLGSFVISGMYMTQTLRNDNLDEKRKKTLAINQGLTLFASMAIAYFVSERLVGPWNKHVAMKYAAKKLNLSGQKFYEGLDKMPKKEKAQFLKDENIRLLAEGLKKHQEKIKALYMEKHPEDTELAKFKKPNLMHYVEKGLKNETLTGKLKGLDVLKSLIIFGSVYRFIGPVAVTPFANWIGNKLFGGDSPNKTQSAQSSSQDNKAKETQNLSRAGGFMPKLDKFIGSAKA